ncbi:MAG: SDR family oxidoreductase [Jatrophihabitantaceae bacterium]
MAIVLVTGGTGRLGQVLVPNLVARGHDVRVLSRRAGDRRAVGDLATGSGLAAAVDGVQAVVHAATSRHMQKVDVQGTARLVAAARAAGVEHLIYVSIVGVDRNPFGYYAAKLAAEQAIARSGLAFTLARGTQFHTLVAGVVRRMRLGPVPFAPAGWQVQPNDHAEFARQLAARVDAGPAGTVTEFGGPEVGTFAEFAAFWHRAHGRPRRVREIPVPGKASAAFRGGAQVCGADAARGEVTFGEWLQQHPA